MKCRRTRVSHLDAPPEPLVGFLRHREQGSLQSYVSLNGRTKTESSDEKERRLYLRGCHSRA